MGRLIYLSFACTLSTHTHTVLTCTYTYAVVVPENA